MVKVSSPVRQLERTPPTPKGVVADLTHSSKYGQVTGVETFTELATTLARWTGSYSLSRHPKAGSLPIYRGPVKRKVAWV